MPSLARKVLVCAAIDGLVLHPLSSKKEQRSGPSVKIRYGDSVIVPAPRDLGIDSTKPGSSFEAFGIVGLVSLSKYSYLISITRRQQVATIRGSPIYVATEVALTPCASFDEAGEAVRRTAQHLKRARGHSSGGGGSGDSSDSDGDSDSDSDSSSSSDSGGDDSDSGGKGSRKRKRDRRKDGGDAEEQVLWQPEDIVDVGSLEDDGAGGAKTGSGMGARNQAGQKNQKNQRNQMNNSIAEDVMSRRGSYGRFAQRWFSRAGWIQEQKRLMGLTGDAKALETDEEAIAEGAVTPEPAAAPEDPSKKPALGEAVARPDRTDAEGEAAANSSSSSSSQDSAVVSLLPKFLRTSHMLLGESRAFYFSYEYDITRSLAKQLRMRWSDLPLHKLVDPLYFWNRHVMQPFLDAGADALALPLMLGFVGQRSFVVDSHPPQIDDGAKDSMELADLSHRASSPSSSPSSPSSPPLSSSPLPQVLGSSFVRIGSPSLSEAGQRRSSERHFDITLISRRSVKRAGLRYLRRGVDEDGNVANAVETEQILSPSEENQTGPDEALSASQPLQQLQPLQQPARLRTYSFVQIRGSIPLFFTQTPFSLKPVPVLQHSAELNFAALKKHFDGLRQQYGSLQIVNLVEKHGVEAALGTQYEEMVHRLGEEESSVRVPFEWFDFHRACKGMKFENVTLLLNTLSRQLEEFGSTVEEEAQSDQNAEADTSEAAAAAGMTAMTMTGSGLLGSPKSAGAGTVVRQQKGVLRTNCMDCLDRTNVCQSSFAKFMLDAQLKEQGFDMLLQHDQENAWFNTLWADNGDAISKQYASTAAMKGDYTRTRKRDYRGALTDAGLSLTRFFNGIVNDFFLQTTIDFLLGNVTDQIFDEFETNMMTKDPAMSMQKMREQAIDLCQRRVVADEKEEFVGGWTLLAPQDAQASLVAPPFEEVVLLLTDVALYLCRVDWNLDKLSSFERVELAHVEEIKVGTYIVSTVTPMQMDETRNVGFAVAYRPGHDDILRINTRSLSSMSGGGDAGSTATDTADVLSSSLANLLGLRTSAGGGGGGGGGAAASLPSKRLAFKALYADTSLATSTAVVANEQGSRLSEKQQIAAIAAEIERLVAHCRPIPAGTERLPLVVHGDIVSLAEARRSTGLLEHLGHSLKKLVWA